MLIEAIDIIKYFPVRKGLFSKMFSTKKQWIHAVDGVDLYINEGDVLGLVGESGSGKTTIGKLLLGLWKPTSGVIKYEGRDINKLDKNEVRKLRREMQIIFQDPYSSLNPRKTVGDIIGLPLELHGLTDKKKRLERVKELLELVQLSPSYINRYPHQFSGGQVQRIGIARALATNPRFVVADEPVSALDVSIQAKILNLMQDLKKEFDLTYLFIAHNLGVINRISNRVAIMYLGKIVELAEVDELFSSPEHPYTQAIIKAVPIANPKVEWGHVILKGEIPSPINPPSGCRFHTRCPKVIQNGNVCKEQEPRLVELRKGHFVACHLFNR